MPPSSPDVLVLGGGLAGASLALALAGRGARVRVLDRGIPGREASSAAAGMLAPQAEVPEVASGLDYAARCLSAWPAFLDRVAAATGGKAEVGFVRSGSVILAWGEAEAEGLRVRAAGQRARGLPAREVTRAELAEIAPDAAGEADLAVHCPDDARVDAPVLVEATVAAARAAGVEVTPLAPVVGLSRRGDRVAGVRLADGERLEAERVVLAAGAWSAGITGVPLARDAVRPCRGVLVVLRMHAPAGAPVLYSQALPPGYACPQPDGTLLLGGTADFPGFQRDVPARLVADVLARAARLSRGAAECPFLGVRVGFRPVSLDDRALVGPSSVLSGLWYCTGHGRTGILCAPPSAFELAPAVLGEGAVPPSLASFDPARIERPAERPGEEASG